MPVQKVEVQQGDKTIIKTKPRIERNRVLVTGGAGFVGSHLCTYLVERGDHVSTSFCNTFTLPTLPMYHVLCTRCFQEGCLTPKILATLSWVLQLWTSLRPACSVRCNTCRAGAF